MNKILIFCCFIFPVLGFSQTFNWESKLETPGSNGFYRIALEPEITTHLKRQFGDIRILDEKNMEVPYLLQVEAPTYYAHLFHEYEVVEKKIIYGCCTYITLRNDKKSKINNLSVLIKNAEVIKNANLYGSNEDQVQYILKQNFRIQNINNLKETSELKIVDFPLSDYLYYTIQINDFYSAPLNIVKAGYYDTHTESGKYALVPAPKHSQTDSISKKKTYVKIEFEQESLLDKLEFSINGGPYFLRRATLYEPQQKKTKKGAIIHYLNELVTTEISSINENTIALPSLKVKELLLVIENDDNPPLEITAVNGFHLNRYLIAWLDKDKQYALKLGNENLNAPKYDLGYFRDSIPASIPALAYGAITSIKKEKKKSGADFFTNTNIIWVAIISVIILLGIMSLKMVKETVGKKN